MELNTQDIIKWLTKTNEKIQANKEYLTTLDQAIGDGDHGINMARGFQEVVNAITEKDYEQAADVLKDAAMTLISKVGGASGPLFGTAFLKMSMAVRGSAAIDYETFTQGLEEGLNGVKQRGKAAAGEKTMIDVWAPVVDFFKEQSDFQAHALKQAAKEAMENTKDMLATKGRASYFKERSIGHIDPGSASSFYIFEALAEMVEGSS